MKYRKVGGPVSNAASVSSCNDLGGAASTTCGVKIIKSHRTLPLHNPKPQSSTTEHQSPGGAVTPDSTKVAIKEKSLEYNNQIPETSKAVVQDFYHLVLENEALVGDHESLQRQLAQVGMLSLEDVLLPAVAHEENCALKLVQKKIQRDNPGQTYIVKDARLAIIECLCEAVVAVRESRQQRHVSDQKREEQWKKDRQAHREQERQKRKVDVERRRTEETKFKEMQAIREKHELKKKLPRNQELWREVAFLMTESSKLSKEERLWKEVESLLTDREKEMDVTEAVATSDDMLEDTMVELKMNLAPFDQSMEDIAHSSNSILQALRMVSDLQADSDKLRRQLYRRYRNDHQFQGYRGVNDPKGLIRILSQDAEEMY